MRNTVNIALLCALVLLASCGTDNSPEAKKKLLEQKEQSLVKLEAEIRDLKAELLLDGDSLAKAPEGVLIGVKVLAPETFEHFFEVNGSVEAIEQANLSPEQGGQIKRMNVKEGDAVKAGQVLATLNTSVISSSLQELESGLALARTTYERQAKLWEQKIGSEMQYLQAKNQVESLEKKRSTLQAQLAMSTISAPFDGVVDLIHQKEGELAAPGMPIITLVNVAQLKVKADVSENHAKAVKVGQMTEVRFPSFGTTLSAPISAVGSIINPANRSFSVEVRVSNPDRTLKPNAVGILRIKDFKAENAMVVPTICVGKDAKGNFLFVVRNEEGQSKAMKTYVSTDRSSEGNTLITEGLKPGDSVIVQGYNEVANGNIVRVQ
ncbi:MAG: efflux RND transporter periplasmic adaptor subunit [Flavobacteriales bacterium]|nr:efflux RND transporter periplasmic adaptor subunit [Flavobacteriales bacterium]